MGEDIQSTMSLVDEIVKMISNDTDGRKYGLNDIDGATIDVVSSITKSEIEKRVDERIAYLKKKMNAQKQLNGNFHNTILRLDEMKQIKEMLK